MLAKWIAVVGMLTFGTVSSIMSKINFEVKGLNLDGKLVPFHKPWFCVLVMFIGMSGCLAIYVAPLAWEAACGKRRRINPPPSRRSTSDNGAPDLGPAGDSAYLESLLAKDNGGGGGGDDADEPPLDPPSCNCSQVTQMLMIAIPTAFDLIATVLMSIGLLYVTVSIYQMMRGAELIFAAIFSVLFLGKKLYKLHYCGIALALIGITMVGTASVLGPEQNNTGTKQEQILGISLIILSQAIQAGQICFEEHFMKSMDFMKPTLVVGLEGLFGVLMQALIVLPVAQELPGGDFGGKLENTRDSLHMIACSKDHVILVALGFTAVVMLFYNVLGMQVTGHLGALFRSILETTRTLLAWIVGLALYYGNVTLYGDPIGEAWDNYSYLQLAGFVILVTGTLIYGHGDSRPAPHDDYTILGSERSHRHLSSSGSATQAISIGTAANRVDPSPNVSFTPSSMSRLNAYYDFGSVSRSQQMNNYLAGTETPNIIVSQ